MLDRITKLRNVNRWSGDIHKTFQVEQLEDRRLLAAAIEMTDQEQLLVELVNRARANPPAEAARVGVTLNQDLSPGEISTEPKQPLSPNQPLIEAARGHSQAMLDFNFFGHENPITGSDPSQRAKDAGYPRGAGENIAWFGSGDQINRNQEVYDRHDALYISSGHRVNFFNEGWREVGMGIKYGFFVDQTSERPHPLQSIMVAESFGSRPGNSFITGVAYTDRVVPDNFYTIGEGIEGLTVRAVRKLDGKTFTVQTGPSGGYGLQVDSGFYTVTGSKAGIETFVVSNVVVNGPNQKVDFNTRNPGFGSIQGTVFNDLNENGRQDANEPGIANQKIFIDEIENDRLDGHEIFVTTNGAGKYSINGLLAGDYRVRLSPPADRPISAPDPVDLYDITLRKGLTLTSVDFGLSPVNQPPIVVDDFAETRSGVSVVIDVIANDSDLEGFVDPQTVEVVAGPVNENATVRVDRTTGEVVYIPEPGYTGPDAFAYTVKDNHGFESDSARVDIRVTKSAGPIWQNANNRFDVNDDGFLSARDVLLIVANINEFGARELTISSGAPPPYIDASGDGFVSAIDALVVTTEVNRTLSASAEGEFDSVVAAAMRRQDAKIESVGERSHAQPPFAGRRRAALILPFAAPEFDSPEDDRRKEEIDRLMTDDDFHLILEFELEY